MRPQVADPVQAYVLDVHTEVGALARREGDLLRCVACGHRCLLGEGKRGTCKVRFVRDGELRVPWGYVAGLACDPVEKKPFFHVLPASGALTFGMLGCDLHCAYCQNWFTSQALRDASAQGTHRVITGPQIAAAAIRAKAKLVVSSYNEPLITAEWGVEVFRHAKAAGLGCAFVSNGNATPEVLDFIRPWIVAYKVDLKTFQDRHYRTLGTTLANVTETIRMVYERGIWLEVVTLLIPGFNDSREELVQAAEFLASISTDIPWHVTAFHKDYRMTQPEATEPDSLIAAVEIGQAAGLRYVYAGNRPGQVGPLENTRCASCQHTLIERRGFTVLSNGLTDEGLCTSCGARLPGVWKLP